MPEALRLTAAAPLLLKLPERSWGAATALPGSLVSNLAGLQIALHTLRRHNWLNSLWKHGH